MGEGFAQVFFNHVSADAKPAGDLCLFQVLEFTQTKHLLTPWRQFLHRLQQMSQAFLLNQKTFWMGFVVGNIFWKDAAFDVAGPHPVAADKVDHQVAGDSVQIRAGVFHGIGGRTRCDPHPGFLYDVLRHRRTPDPAGHKPLQLVVMAFKGLHQRSQMTSLHIITI